jgi:hypothetical protein
MEHLYTSLRFSAWALEGTVFLPPLSIALVLSTVSLVWAGIKQRPIRTERWRPYYWLVVTHSFFFVAAIAVAVFGANPITNPTVPHPPIPAAKHCLDFVTLGSFVSCGFWVWRMRGMRWFATSLMLVAEVITYGALFIAGMAVSGDWL